jgi:hypothetical protein
VQGEPALLPTAHGSVEVDQLGLGHGGQRYHTPDRTPEIIE